jgi:hypothetical protein
MLLEKNPPELPQVGFSFERPRGSAEKKGGALALEGYASVGVGISIEGYTSDRLQP